MAARVRVASPHPRPIAELRVASLDPAASEETFAIVDEFGAIRILSRPDGRSWEMSLGALSQALFEAEDRLHDVDDT